MERKKKKKMSGHKILQFIHRKRIIIHNDNDFFYTTLNEDGLSLHFSVINFESVE